MKNKKGSLLVVSLVILGLILLIGLSLSLVASKELRSSSTSEKSNNAYQIAESGVEKVVEEIKKGNTTVSAVRSANSPVLACSGRQVTVPIEGYAPADYPKVTFKSDVSNSSNLTCDNNSANIAYVKAVGISQGTTRAVDLEIHTENKDTVGVFRSSNGRFLLRNSNDAGSVNITLNASSWDAAGDIPVAGDWDGDNSHITTVGLYRPSNRTFYLKNSNAGNSYDPPSIDTSLWPDTGDFPVVGDWDGDGKTEIGLFRRSNYNFQLDVNGNGTYETGNPPEDYDSGSLNFNPNAATRDNNLYPISGDWNGDGKDEIGLFRRGNWWLDYDGDMDWDSSKDKNFSFGRNDGLPVTGDWNGDGIAEVGTYRQNSGDREFRLDLNGNYQWDSTPVDSDFDYGSAGDWPLAGDWNGLP